MHIYAKIRVAVFQAIETCVTAGTLPHGMDTSKVTAEPPKDTTHGDVATNAAMVLAKQAKQAPRDVAALLVEALERHTDITQADIAGPGFINLTLATSCWHQIIVDVLEAGRSYGEADVGQGHKVNVEYCSANPTGPLHIGHARGAVVGDVLARLLTKAGFNVTKEYYINDAGNQINLLAQSAYLRYREARGEDIGEIPEGLYPGEYLKIVGESFAQQHGSDYMNVSDAEWMPVMKDFAVEALLVLIREDLRMLGITHDVFTSEKALADAGALDKGIQALEEKGLVYTGILEPPKGKTPEDWEPAKQLLFKATKFGDDVDRPLKKSDGTPTYFAADVAYHQDKLKRGFHHMILELGADHGGYVKRLKAVVKALSDGGANVEVLLHQMVNLMKAGEPYKMSKRAGTIVTAQQLVEDVGKDVLRFIMLTRKPEATLDFDVQLVQEQSKDNPVFYVQYAHARIHSVKRQCLEQLPEAAKKDLKSVTVKQLTALSDPQELALIQLIAQWPRVVESAALTHEPHRIAFYLQELAAGFHSLWNAGRDDEYLRFIVADDMALTTARLALIDACATTIASGLHVMGVEPVMQM